MPLNVNIASGGINPDVATVTSENSLQFVEQPAPPPPGGSQVMRVFRQYLTDDGTSTGTSDMQVSASAGSPQEFWVPSNLTQNKDRYICVLSFVVADQLAALNNFGNISALTNGCQLEYVDEDGIVTIHGALQTNWDFIRLCLGNPAFGDGTGSFRASNVSGVSEGYIPFLDLRQTFGFKWGLKLSAFSRQKLVLRVQDDTTGVDQFDCIAYGFERSG